MNSAFNGRHDTSNDDAVVPALLRAIESSTFAIQFCEPEPSVEPDPLPLPVDLEPGPEEISLPIPDPYRFPPSRIAGSRITVPTIRMVSKEAAALASGEIHSIALSPLPLPEPDSVIWHPEVDVFRPPAPEEVSNRQRLANVGSFFRRIVPGTRPPRLPSRGTLRAESALEEVQKPVDPRRYTRQVNPPLAAFYWTGGPPIAHIVADMSAGGLYMLTRDRWRPGTRLSVTVRRTDRSTKAPENWIVVDFIVVRWGSDGVAGAFIPYLAGNLNNAAAKAQQCADREMIEKFMQQFNSCDPEAPQLMIASSGRP